MTMITLDTAWRNDLMVYKFCVTCLSLGLVLRPLDWVFSGIVSFGGNEPLRSD